MESGLSKFFEGCFKLATFTLDVPHRIAHTRHDLCRWRYLLYDMNFYITAKYVFSVRAGREKCNKHRQKNGISVFYVSPRLPRASLLILFCHQCRRKQKYTFAVCEVRIFSAKKSLILEPFTFFFPCFRIVILLIVGVITVIGHLENARKRHVSFSLHLAGWKNH